jgi:hypothetical protein
MKIRLSLMFSLAYELQHVQTDRDQDQKPMANTGNRLSFPQMICSRRRRSLICVQRKCVDDHQEKGFERRGDCCERERVKYVDQIGMWSIWKRVMNVGSCAGRKEAELAGAEK